MQEYVIDSLESLEDFNYSLKNNLIQLQYYGKDIIAIVNTRRSRIKVNPEFLPLLEIPVSDIDKIIYGKNPLDKIVNISYKDNNIHIFRDDIEIQEIVVPYKHWVLSNFSTADTIPLSGKNHYKYLREYRDEDEYKACKSAIYKNNLYNIAYMPEAFMVRHGFTYYKNLTPQSVSILSFDIETSGLNPEAPDAEVFIITNTLRIGGKVSRKTFNLREYHDKGLIDSDMIEDWCTWVRKENPSILCGHNIILFDLPYLHERSYRGLKLGRDDSYMTIEEKTRELRKDGSQSYSYNRKSVFGREICDTFFLAIKYDIGRKYESYGLKAIIRAEGKEKADRTFIDASKIREYYYRDQHNWNLTLKYAEEDSDDALMLYDLMVAVSFYMGNSVPKTFQHILESASGSQLNSILVRAYVQNNESIPKASEATEYQGAISFAIPGIYKNCLKIDFSQLYPSIMMQYEVYDKVKDPHKHFASIVKYFADNRQKYKKLYKDTGDKKYDDLQGFAKTIANSCYGFLGASGLNFNSPLQASFITEKGRELLQFTIEHFTSRKTESWIEEFKAKTSK